jgi:O-antigen ligase
VAFVLVLQRPHVGISIFLTTFLVNYPGVARGTGALTINNMLGMQFILLLAWSYYRDRDAWYLRDPLVRILLLIGGIFVIGTIAAEFTLPDSHIQALIVRRLGVSAKTDFTQRFIFQYFSRVAFLIFVLRFVKTPRQLRGVFLVVLACTLVAVPPALSAVRSGGAEARALTRLVSWADNANRFAFGMLLGATLFYYFGSVSRDWRVKLASGIGAATLVPVALLSASRSGFLGLFLVGFLMLVGAFGGERRSRLAGSGLVIVLLMTVSGALTYTYVLSPALQERLLNLNPFAEQQGIEGSASTEFRTATLENSIRIIKEHPVFGVGIGNFRWYHKLRQGRFKPPHNSYVWSLAEGGVPLLAAYLLFFATLWRRLGRSREAYADHPVLPRFPQWLRVYVILLLFFSMFADVWLEEHIFLLAAAAILLDRWRVTEVAAAPTPTPAPTAPERWHPKPSMYPPLPSAAQS